MKRKRYDLLFGVACLALLNASCSSTPASDVIQSEIATTQAAALTVAALATNTPTPRPSKTPAPTATPRPTSTATPTPTLDPIFESHDALCQHLFGLSEIQRDAFSQQYKGMPVGPWKGRVRYYFAGDSVFFFMDAPDYNDQPRREVNLSFPEEDYRINDIYEFYGTFLGYVGTGSYSCVVLLMADEREEENRITSE